MLPGAKTLLCRPVDRAKLGVGPSFLKERYCFEQIYFDSLTRLGSIIFQIFSNTRFYMFLSS